MAGVFLGSIGFPVIYALRQHLWHVRKWSLHVKLTLITTIALFFAGGVAFLILEYDNLLTLGTQDAWDTTFQAFFLSAMTRSGGFAILDIGELNGSSLLVGCMLMFVGGGSASTAGGIKVTTLAVIALAVWSEAKGRQSNQVFGRRIPSDVLRVALSVVAWGATIVALVDHRHHPDHQGASSTGCSSTSSRGSRPSVCRRDSRRSCPTRRST